MILIESVKYYCIYIFINIIIQFFYIMLVLNIIAISNDNLYINNIIRNSLNS